MTFSSALGTRMRIARLMSFLLVGVGLLAVLIIVKGSRSGPTLVAAPNGTNTGVPAGVSLTIYEGPTVITECGTVIDRKIVRSGLDIRVGNGTHSAATPCVTVRNSLIKGVIDSGFSRQGYGPVVLTDVEVDAGKVATSRSSIVESNFYLERVNVHGGGHGALQCDGYCEVRDSWTHDFFFVARVHYDGFESSGNDGRPIVLDHNTFGCGFVNPADEDGIGGCSADIGFFGDFATIRTVTVTNNKMTASTDVSWCVYTAASKPGKTYAVGTNLVWRGNTFGRGTNAKCGSYGPVADWAYGNGNIWQANVWSDGTALDQ